MSTQNDPTDSLLEELKNLNKTLKTEINGASIENTTISVAVSAAPRVIPTVTVTPDLTEEGINQFILQSAQKIILNGLETIESLKDLVVNTADFKTITAYSEIMGATNATIATLNSLNIEKRKAASAKELKTMDIEAKKQLGSGGGKTTNNINIVASREQVIKMLEQAENPKVIDIKDSSSSTENLQSP